MVRAVAGVSLLALLPALVGAGVRPACEGGVSCASPSGPGARQVPAPADVRQARLDVHVTDETQAAGLAGVALWFGDQGFPEDISHALRTVYVALVDGEAHAAFEQLDPGRYAVTVYHDKNDNREFDKNWVGMPREAWGVSNNVRPRLRAPRFDEAVLNLSAGEHTIDIRIE
jgi:uncharacterized protein (DUF2141 family)